MNIATVCSGDFARRAINLIGSFFANGGDGTALFCYWNVDTRVLQAIHDYYGDRVRLQEVECLCDHARNPRLYFFKTYTVYQAMRSDEPFIYLDAAEEVIDDISDLRNDLEHATRLFIQYPPVDVLKNGNWTTRKCLRKMGCDEPRYYACPQYMGGFQAYLPTTENKKHVNEMFNMMLDPDISGPSNWTHYPEGQDGCRGHRNDQSVLSTLIERNGWHQPFNPETFMRYGDYPTLQVYAPDVVPDPHGYKQTIIPRQDTSRSVPRPIRDRLGW